MTLPPRLAFLLALGCCSSRCLLFSIPPTSPSLRPTHHLRHTALILANICSIYRASAPRTPGYWLPPLSPLQLLSSTSAPTQCLAWLSWPHPFPCPMLVPLPSAPLVWKNPVQVPGPASSSPAWLALLLIELSAQLALPQRRPSDVKCHFPSPTPGLA